MNDSISHFITCSNATEDVDENRLHTGVAQNDFQPVGHYLCRSATADIEEVSWRHATEFLTGVGNDIKGGHHQSGAISDDADFAV